MVWNILVIIALVLSLWAVWASWQNTKTLQSIYRCIDHLTDVLRNGDLFDDQS